MYQDQAKNGSGMGARLHDLAEQMNKEAKGDQLRYLKWLFITFNWLIYWQKTDCSSHLLKMHKA